MKHIDSVEIGLAEAVKNLIFCSSGNIEDVGRELLLITSLFLNSQRSDASCNGINTPEGFVRAAAEAYALAANGKDLPPNRPGMDFSLAITRLMQGAKKSSESAKDVVEETLIGACCFIQNSENAKDVGDLNSAEAFGKAAEKEYQELFDWRAEHEAQRIKGESNPNRYRKPIACELVKRNLKKEITKEEMYRLNDERIAAEEQLTDSKCLDCKGSGEGEYYVCDQGQHGGALKCDSCNGTGVK